MATGPTYRELPTARTAKHIAYSLIGVFGSALLIIGVFAGVLELRGLASGPWFELLKSGFLILGGALSTVVGYYFGSRGIQEAEERAEAAERELQRVERLRIQDAEAPTTGEGDLIDPEQFTGIAR